MTNLSDLVGYLAAFCTTAAYVPQAIKAWRSGSTEDLSLWMLITLVTGLGLWAAYGIAKGDIPLIAANGVTFCLAGTVLALKLRQG